MGKALGEMEHFGVAGAHGFMGRFKGHDSTLMVEMKQLTEDLYMDKGKKNKKDLRVSFYV